MGIEVQRDGTLILLVLDPSHAPQQMAQFGDTSTGSAALRLLRKSEASMKARQYQIVAVVGTIDCEQQYQVKTILTEIKSLSNEQINCSKARFWKAFEYQRIGEVALWSPEEYYVLV